MYDIPMDAVSDEFVACWQAAGRYLQRTAQGPMSWLRAHVDPPFLEHLSFRLGNQLFFVRIEDTHQRIEVPGSRDGLIAIANGCRGHPCIMPMSRRLAEWMPEHGGWGLIHVNSGQ